MVSGWDGYAMLHLLQRDTAVNLWRVTCARCGCRLAGRVRLPGKWSDAECAEESPIQDPSNQHLCSCRQGFALAIAQTDVCIAEFYPCVHLLTIFRHPRSEDQPATNKKFNEKLRCVQEWELSLGKHHLRDMAPLFQRRLDREVDTRSSRLVFQSASLFLSVHVVVLGSVPSCVHLRAHHADLVPPSKKRASTSASCRSPHLLKTAVVLDRIDHHALHYQGSEVVTCLLTWVHDAFDFKPPPTKAAMPSVAERYRVRQGKSCHQLPVIVPSHSAASTVFSARTVREETKSGENPLAQLRQKNNNVWEQCR